MDPTTSAFTRVWNMSSGFNACSVSTLPTDSCSKLINNVYVKGIGEYSELVRTELSYWNLLFLEIFLYLPQI